MYWSQKLFRFWAFQFSFFLLYSCFWLLCGDASFRLLDTVFPWEVNKSVILLLKWILVLQSFNSCYGDLETLKVDELSTTLIRLVIWMSYLSFWSDWLFYIQLIQPCPFEILGMIMQQKDRTRELFGQKYYFHAFVVKVASCLVHL